MEAERRANSPSSTVGGSVGPLKRVKPDSRESHSKEIRWRKERNMEKALETIREMRRQGILAKIKKAKIIKSAQKAQIEERKRRREKQNKKKLGAFTKKMLTRIIRAMNFNVEGINQLNKRQEIEEYAWKNAISIALCTETQHAHTSEEGGTERMNPEGKGVRGKYKR